MPHLAAVYSDHLCALLLSGGVRIDAVELTPWQKLTSLPDILPDLQGMQVFFHGSNLTSRFLLLPGARARLKEFLRLTHSTWYSTHLSLLPPGWVWLAQRFGVYLPSPPVRWLLPSFIRAVQRLHRDIALPLLLENMPVDPRGIYKDGKSPLLIREVLNRTVCGLLLDLPHARIAAEAFDMQVIDYLEQLPLERVGEIHVSGPERRPDGVLLDRHQVMQAEDYALLEWALAHTPARLVTLEYFRDRDGLQEQLPRLSSICQSTQ